MLKTKLPVIVLRNIVLLPLGEIKLEVEEVLDKEIIYNAINEHNGYVLLVSPKYATNDVLTKEDLPKIGIIGKITSNFELPNTNIRISIAGINRAFIYDYIQDGDLVKVDGGVGYKGYHSDAARTNLVGNVSDENKLLAERTKQSFFEMELMLFFV